MERDQYLNIKRPEKTCLLCGCSLIEVEKHPSIITEQSVEPIRKDFCPKCWEQLQDRDYFSYWITRRFKPDAPQRLTRKERNDLLLRFFEYLNQKQDESCSYTLYYLAHLLMRYKIFHWKGTRIVPGDMEKNIPPKTFLIFENRRTGEEIPVPDQELDGEKITSSKKEIDEYLQSNLPEEVE